jgi:hypothetical protein
MSRPPLGFQTDASLYVARCGRNAPIVCYDLYVQALDGSGPHNLTEGIDGSLINGVDNVYCHRSIRHPIRQCSRDNRPRLRTADRAHPAGRQSYPLDRLATYRCPVSSDQRWTNWLCTARRRPGRDRLGSSRRSGAFAHHTRLACPDLQPIDWRPLQGRRLEWVSDNHAIDALLYIPAGATTQARFPLVVDVHGGPAGRFDDSDYPLVRLLLEEGWAVLHVNPRGSLGYGTDFLASIQDDLGGADYRDIMTGVDAALAQAPIDSKRLAMIGFSYGGTITSFALGRTDRFKALVAAAPVVDQISEYGTESSSWYDRWYFGQPWTPARRRVAAKSAVPG